MTSRLDRLVDQLQRGTIDRRTFMVRAIALGATSSAVMSALSRVGRAAAQDESAASIGNPDIPHVEGTDKGLIKVYSSWPRTGSMEGIGVDALEAAKLAFADFGNMAGGFAIEYVPLDSGIAATTAAGIQVSSRRTRTRLSPTPTAWSTWERTTLARPRSPSRS